MNPLYVRLAALTDMDEITAVFDKARAFMRAHGNNAQWGNGYPSLSLLAQDIAAKQLYVMEDEGRICGVFAFIPGTDPTYLKIENGAWLSDAPYGTLHRLASDGTVHGVFNAALKFCETIDPHIRIDTHEDNLPMRNAILKNGFRECGVIHLADGSPRIAYEKI